MPDELTLTSTQVVGLFETRSVLDNPTFDLSDPKSWDAIFGDQHDTDAGISITKKKALECAPFWQAVQLIAGDCGMIPLAPYRQKSAHGRTYWEEDTRHWTYSLTRVQASDDQTSQDYWERLTADALVWGDGWGWIAFDMSERPSELFHLLPDRTAWETINGSRYCVSEIGGEVKVFDPTEILHISGLKPLGGEVPDFVKQARNTLGALLASNSFVSKYFKNGGRMGGILELPREMPKKVADTQEEGFRKTYESSEAFKTIVLRDNAKFHAAQTTPKDMETTTNSERLARDVARWFGLPPSMLGVEGSSSYNSKAEDGTGYVTHCLNRWLKKIQGQCRLRLLPKRERATVEYRHDTDELFKMDLESRMRAYATGIACKVYNPNDGRLREGLAPYAEGEEYANPNTSSPGESDPPDEQPPALDVNGKRALLACTLAARHKSGKPNAFVDFVGKLPDVAPWQVDLRTAFNVVMESTNADGLQAAVESVCVKYEQIYLG